MENIIYTISIILLFVIFCIIKRTEDKIDIIPNIIITFLSMLAYQLVICLGFSIISISINLVNLSICNFLISAIFLILLKKKGIQKYKLIKKDAIITLAIIVLCSLILYQDIGNLENIRYYSTDASIHYISAKEFYQNDKMLNQTQNTETNKQLMPMAYVNVGILFKVLEPVVKEINFYKIFLWFDSTIFCFSAILFYFIIKNIVEKKWHFLLASILTIVYLLGYPLNNLLSGFYYLGIGCLMINAILYHRQNTYDNKIIKILITFLLNIGIIFSYALFAPVIYLATFLIDSYSNYQQYHKIINKEFIFNTIITLIVPGIIAIAFLILPNTAVVQAITNEGYIYKSLFINIIFFFPFAVYGLLAQIREKKVDFKLLYFLILIIYMILLYSGTKFKIVSEYYFYKNAYILWAILILYFFYGIVKFVQKYKEGKILSIVYCTMYFCLIFATIVTQRHILNIFDIYENNIVLINQKENLTQDDINMLSYIKDNNLLSKTENNILFIGDFMQEAWIRSIFQYRNRYPLEKANHMQYVKKWNNGEIPYLVCFEKSGTYQRIKNNCHLEGAKLIFATQYAKLYQK